MGETENKHKEKMREVRSKENYKTSEASITFIFFFHADDGIRDLTVTGVQPCALPIFETNTINSHYYTILI